MTELIDLTKVLKVGDKVYCALTGLIHEVLSISSKANYKIELEAFDSNFTEYGQFYNKPYSEPQLFPSKTQRDWQKYIDDKAEEQKRADLLEKAKIDYPIGTIISKNPEYVVTGIPFLDNHPNASVSVLCNKFYERYLYFAETWAPILTKEKLFTTEDCVDVFEGDIYLSVTKNNFSISMITANNYSGRNGNIVWYFSTKEAAEKFISEEKGRRLLEEAKLRYPVGTEFSSAFPCNSRSKCFSNGRFLFENKVELYENIIWAHNNSNKKCGWVYCNGTWADIISSPYTDCKSSPFTTEQENWIKNQINLNNRRDKCE